MIVEYNITGIGAFKAQLEGIRERLTDKNMLLETVANPLINATTKSFESESDYFGVPWARLKPATIKAKGHDKILYGEGKLQGSLSSDINNDEVWVGVNASYRGFQYGLSQHFGSEKRNIPARRFLPMDEDGELFDEVVEDIIQMVGDYLELDFK